MGLKEIIFILWRIMRNFLLSFSNLLSFLLTYKDFISIHGCIVKSLILMGGSPSGCGIGFCYSPKKGPQDPSTQSLDFMVSIFIWFLFSLGNKDPAIFSFSFCLVSN